MSPVHPGCLRNLHALNDEQRAPMLKRRVSAPAGAPFANTFSVARKKLRLSEPDDISATSVSSHSFPRNKKVISLSTSLGQPDPSPAANGRAYRASDVDSHHMDRRPSRPPLATVAKCARVHTTRPKPNLSVRIPKPLVTPPYGPSPITDTPTSPMPLSSSAHLDNERTGNMLSRHKPLRNGHQQPPTSFPPHTPTTPLEQVIVRRPTNPPAIKPRHSRGHDNNGDEAYNRRVERLFAPTPTEWTFSSTLNRVPTPLNDCFDLGTPTVSEVDLSKDQRDKMLIEDEREGVSSLEGPLGYELPNFPRMGHALSLLAGHPSSTMVNTNAVQPLASPYATRFPSPAASIISLAPSGPASGASTPRSISPVASFSSTRSRTNCNSVGGASNAHNNACNGVSATSVPFPSLFSPTAPNLIGVGSGVPLRRPSIVRRRSSLGPSRLSLGSSISTDGGKLRQPRRSATSIVAGYFDCPPELLATTGHVETTPDAVDTDTEMELDDYPTTTASTPAVDV